MTQAGLLLHGASLAHPGVKDFLADTQRFWCYFQQLISINEVERLLKAEDPRRCKAECFIGAGGTGIGEVFGLADI